MADLIGDPIIESLKPELRSYLYSEWGEKEITDSTQKQTESSQRGADAAVGALCVVYQTDAYMMQHVFSRLRYLGTTC